MMGEAVHKQIGHGPGVDRGVIADHAVEHGEEGGECGCRFSFSCRIDLLKTNDLGYS